MSPDMFFRLDNHPPSALELTMNPTKNDIPAKTRTAVADLLNERLADLIDLQLQTKQAHWNVKGPTFIALHELFDSIAEELEDHVDDVAERITALGGIAEGTVGAVGKRTTLAAYPLKITAGRDHVDALSTAIALTGKNVRAAIDQCNELGDADAADLFTGISRDLDKKLWFVEAHLQGDK
jgi:starvation-inducible DNA-binding protein